MKKLIAILLNNIIIVGSFSTSFAEPSSWAVDSINEMMSYEQFNPEAFKNYQGNITRQEFIYFAVRVYELLDGKEISLDPNISFKDTDDIYALKGASIGLTTGIGDGEFGANYFLSREQLATFMVRIYTLLELEMNPASLEKFADDDKISDWAKESIYKAKSNQIISGVGNNNVDPKGVASTEMAIVIANRILKNNGYKANVKPLNLGPVF